MAFPAIAAVLGGLGGAAKMALKADIAFKILTSTLSGFVNKSNPGQMTRFSIALDDTLAALGRSFEPLMESVIRIIGMVGDTFAGFEPVLRPIAAAIGSIGETLTRIFLDDIEKFAVPLALVATLFKTVAEVVAELADPLRKLGDIIVDILGLTDMKNAAFNRNARAAGSAARNYKIFSSGDELQKANALQAIRTGPSMQERVQDATIELPKLLRDLIDAIKSAIKTISDFLSAISPMSNKELGDLGLDSGPLGRIEGIMAKVLSMMQK
jgi:phage-related minor tail protein